MDVQIESAEPTEAVQSAKAETPEWIEFTGNETGDLPAGIVPDTPIAIRLRQGTELCVFAGDSYNLPLGNWDHADHAKDVVAYRLLTPKEAREFVGSEAVIKYVSRYLTREIHHWRGLVDGLKERFSNPLFEHMLPKLVAALHYPEDSGHKAVTANTSKSEAWVLQQVMPAFSEPPE